MTQSALSVDSRRLEYTVAGDGPAILLPQCNEAWTSFGYIDALKDHYTVVTASPRGYFGSDRESSTNDYTLERLRADLLTIADASGLDMFAVWGYSLTGAIAAFLATQTDRVTALVVGGFPLFGSYDCFIPDEPEHLPDARFDTKASWAFYKAMLGLDHDRLLLDVECPKLAYWGKEDGIISVCLPLDEQIARLTAAGFHNKQLEGLDHGDCLMRSDLVVPIVDNFLRSKLSL